MTIQMQTILAAMTPADYFTLASLVLTFVYICLTYCVLSANKKAVEAMREQITASVRPYVYFDLEPTGPAIEGVLRNTGVSAAYDVIVTLKPTPVVKNRGGTIQESGILNKTVSLMAPQKAIREFLGTILDLEKDLGSLRFTGEVSYRDATKRKFNETFEIDLTYLTKTSHIRRTTIEDELKNINEKFSDLIEIEKRKSVSV